MSPLPKLAVVRELPRTRGECQDGQRPCPFIHCRYHLATKLLDGSRRLKVRFVPRGQDTCALDVADRGHHTLEEVGALLGVTRERARQIEISALFKLRGELECLAGIGLGARPMKGEDDEFAVLLGDGREGRAPLCAVCDRTNQTVRLCDACAPIRQRRLERTHHTPTAPDRVPRRRRRNPAQVDARSASQTPRPQAPKLAERTQQILQLVGFYQSSTTAVRAADCRHRMGGQRRPLLSEVAFLVGVPAAVLDTPVERPLMHAIRLGNAE